MHQLIEKNRKQISSLAKQHGVYGGETNASEVDFLVELDKQHNLFDLARLQMDLQALLQRKVDVATKKALH